MRNKKTWILAVLAVAVAAGTAAVLILRRPAGPEIELLELLPPDSGVYGVADVEWMAQNPALRTLLSDPPGLPHDQEYEAFIRATGFHYQGDLKRLALARIGDNWLGAARVHIDRARVVQYLDSQGAEKTDALGKTVYVFGHARPFRIVFLDDGASGSLIAFSVGGDIAPIRQAVERRSGALRDSAASEQQHNGDQAHIPPESRFWIVARPEMLWGANDADAQIGSLGLSASLFRGSRMLYISLPGSAAGVALRLEDYCDTPASAQRIAGTVRGLLALLKAVPAKKPLSRGDSEDSAASKTAVPPPSAEDLLAAIAVEQAQQSVTIQLRLDEQVIRFLESNEPSR